MGKERPEQSFNFLRGKIFVVIFPEGGLLAFFFYSNQFSFFEEAGIYKKFLQSKKTLVKIITEG